MEGYKRSMHHTIKVNNPLIQRWLKDLSEEADKKTDLMTHYKDKLRAPRFLEFGTVFKHSSYGELVFILNVGMHHDENMKKYWLQETALMTHQGQERMQVKLDVT